MNYISVDKGFLLIKSKLAIVLKITFFLVLLFLPITTFSENDENLIPCGGKFEDFLSMVSDKALRKGISRAAIIRTLATVKLSKKVLAMDRRQSAFRMSFLDFSNRAVNPYRLKNGKKNIKKYRNTFLIAEKRFGVPASVITAFWAMETDFGAVQGTFNTISALATLAHDCRRPNLFQPELIAAIELVDRNIIDPMTTGAWAGEIGQVQMLPMDILEFGTDANGDGLVDLKGSSEDSIMTAAALIHHMGWNFKGAWIQEILLPKEFPWEETGFGRGNTISYWKKLGVKPRSGTFKANIDTTTTILLPQGRKGPKFLAYPNYEIYLSWNDSFIYTVTAAYLATRFEGEPSRFEEGPEPILAKPKMIELQKALVSLGYNVGKLDGILGFNTRQSVRQIQLKLGLPADSWPTEELLDILKR